MTSKNCDITIKYKDKEIHTDSKTLDKLSKGLKNGMIGIDHNHLCQCHQAPVRFIADESTGERKYFCSENGKQLFNYFKEVNMPEKENPGTMPPIDEDDETKEAITMVEKPIFTEEELEEERKSMEAEEETEPEQLSMFEGDKIFNQLHLSLTEVNESLKKVDKAIEGKQMEKKLLLKRKKGLEEAIEDRRSEKIEE